jgi:GDP-L-fucose synthase
MNEILVTGGTGLIGTYLQQLLPKAKYVSSKDYNLLNIDEVKKMFFEVKPKKVIHLAAIVGGVHHNIEEPVKYFEENLLMNTFILKESFANNVENFLGILSSCIYPDDINEYPIKETELLNGAPHKDLFSYSYAKRCMAIHIDMYNKKFKTKYNYIIPCNLYGEFDKFDSIKGHFVGALIQKIIEAKIKKKSKITLFGDGTPYRQFMHAKDVAKIISIMISKKKFFNMNIATNENYSIEHIAKIALEACDASDISIEYDSTKPNGQMRKDIEISNMVKYFPEFTAIKLKDGIRDIYRKKMKHK